MRFKYQQINFTAPTMAVIDQANLIITEYREDGFTLTLRQLYYQFVARGLMANKQRNYKRLGGIINDARLAGLIDWDAIEDRTRNLTANSHWTSPSNIIDACAAGYRRDLWANQPFRVEVWIEKEALAGVIAGPCEELDVPYFSCRGYVSQSEQRKAGLRALQADRDGHRQTIILHLGDHDPSGVDMTRDNQDRLLMFTRSHTHRKVEVIRIALNMDQVEELNPPPNPAKFTDSRCRDYVAKFGHESWELDALEPRYIDRLIRSHVNEWMDHGLMEEAIARQEHERGRLVALAAELSREDS